LLLLLLLLLPPPPPPLWVQVALGEPHFIEIKGVTFCGDQKGSGITLKSVPYHSEVVGFAQALVAAIEREGMAGKYAVACEHQHSCCVLIAHVRYRINGTWHTHIDYDAFLAAWRRSRTSIANGTEATALGGEEGASRLDVMSYVLPTPQWALLGAPEVQQ